MTNGLNISKDSLVEFCQRWKVTEFAIFGSAARGQLRPDSDIDVMVTFLPDSGISLWDFVTMRDELSELFSRPVDLVERGSIRNPFRKHNIEQDLTIIYAA